MKNSLLQQILNLKKEFNDQALSTYSVMDWFNGATGLAVSHSWIDEEGHSYSIDLPDGTGTGAITILTDLGSRVFNLTEQQVEDLRTGGMEAFQYINFGDTNLASGLKSLSSSAKRVESLGSITSLFQTNSRVKYETIVNLLDTQDFAGLDVSAFKLCLSNCQDESGLISQYNWLQLISNLYEDRKQAVDEGSLNLDTGGVNWISNLVGSVIAGIFSAVGAILLAVGGVIVKVIGLVVTAIGFVVQKITDFITNEAVHTRPYVKDPYSSTSYVDGPLVKNIGMYTLNLPDEYSRQAGLIQTGPMDYYMFRGVDGKLNCNAFLDLSVNVGAAFSYLRGRLSPTFRYYPLPNCNYRT